MTPRFVYGYLNQGEFWYPDGRPRLPITEMDDRWRGNAARWLERDARSFLAAYQLGELERMTAPVWLDVVGVKDGQPVTAGPARSELDSMSDASMDAFVADDDERQSDPAAWIRTTDLYKALLPGEQTS